MAAACGSNQGSGSGSVDSSLDAGGNRASGATRSGSTGSSSADAGTTDSGTANSGAIDSAYPVDSRASDSAPVEAGAPDSGARDSGVSNAGSTSVIQKVFYLMEENRDSNQVYGASDAPYINGTLMTTYDYAADYVNDVHPSEPNYVWMEAASNNCGDTTFTTDSDPSPSNSTASLDHIVNYLGRVGKTWKSYQENLPGSCGIASTGSYVAKHNPFVFFQDVVGSYTTPSAFCLSHIVDYGNLATDLANGNLADFVEITPNLCDNGHNCANSSVEAFLQSGAVQSLFDYVLNASHHAVLIIDWDESKSTNVHPMLLVAPPSTLVGTHNVTTAVDHSSFVRSIQRIFGVDPSHTDPTTGRPFSWLRNAASASDFSSFFAPSQFP